MAEEARWQKEAMSLSPTITVDFPENSRLGYDSSPNSKFPFLAAWSRIPKAIEQETVGFS